MTQTFVISIECSDRPGMDGLYEARASRGIRPHAAKANTPGEAKAAAVRALLESVATFVAK